MLGWYYLHTNGDLLYKRDFDGMPADLRESSFTVAVWPMDTDDRESAWDILVESWAAGGKKSGIQELADKWGCTDQDAEYYCHGIGAKVFLDGNVWCATRNDFINLQESPVGFGKNALEALAELCKELGYKPSKMWGAKFKDLLKQGQEG